MTRLPHTRRGAAARDDAPADEPRQAGVLPHLTVAIGASAGGLHAFTEFLTSLPADTGMAFVLIQHLDPNHESLLVSLLAAHTAMPVIEVTDGMAVKPDRVFVIPPDATLKISDGHLRISAPAPERAFRWPIDTFFSSLAEDQHHHAVCIVLSGAGSDGSHSLAAVKQQGGLVLAQAGGDGQAMTGMPSAAVATGHVDHLLAAAAMPAKLIAYQESLRAAGPGAGKVADAQPVDESQPDAAQFAAICAAVRARSGHDFSQYKQPTLLRRIRRRMRAAHLDTIADLVRLLHREPAQVDLLLHELLIGVTQFMRDPAAWQALQARVLPGIVAAKGAEQTVRLWVPGCASGEEVYSLAMLLRDLLEGEANAPKVQVFGTDIDATAIEAARRARYGKRSLANLTAEQREKWFVADGTFLRPRREIRELCVFSVHNLIRDPPFSRLDLVSCRNLLIYLGAELQARAIRDFHYALHPGGWLFLGQTEGVAHGATLFAQVDKRHRIFQRREVAAILPTLAPNGIIPGDAPPAAAKPAGPGRVDGAPYAGARLEDALDRSARRALEPYSPAYVVIDRSGNITRFSGGAVGRFLEPSPGAANLSLLGMLRKPLRRAVRANVDKAVDDGGATVVDDSLRLAFDGRIHAITLIVQPISDGRSGRNWYVVAFIDAGLAPRPARRRPTRGDAVAENERELERELAAAQMQLLTTIAELETANEELRAFNEDHQSTNEELRATNEELETATEEMQSVNEELQTVNAELVTKNEQLMRLNDDFQNLLESTQIATIFLDPALRVTRYTPGMTSLFTLRASDVGRPITEISSRLNYGDLAADVAVVIDSRQIVEREIRLAERNATYLIRMRPYRTLDQAIQGVVLTFVDISARQQAQAAAEAGMRHENQTLERRVAERTADLLAANAMLTQQIAERENAEAMLRQSQKLEAVGMLTGGVAHDFNNVLGVIIGNVESLLAAVRDDAERAGEAQEILNSALNGAELTRRLLAFTRQQPLQPRRIDLNALLRNHVVMLRRTFGKSIEIAARLAPDLWQTHADASQIGDALLNLALNARDAMPQGGRLVIETANAHVDASDAGALSGVTAGDYVVMAVVDSGTGMPPDVVARATEPFFTTKPPTVGSGLGLSMIHGFARQSGGHLTITSEVGVGTTVRLYLPREADSAHGVHDASAADESYPRGDEAILLVDDNATLLSLAGRILLGLGYRVRAATSGPEALAMLRSGERFDLLFTDVAMPEGMSGYELAVAARLVQPDLKVLFTTGYATEVPRDGRDERRHMLTKPYRKHDLASAVRAVLDEIAPPV